MKKGLWTKNFTIITIGTIISSIGGVAMNFALSFVVFDNSGSTLLMGIYSALSLIPTVVLPIVIAPYLDRYKRKPFIVGLDFLNGLLYLGFAFLISKIGFVFGVYLAFSLATATIGTIYQQAYTSYYPNLIPKGFAQKGYTVSSMIYPTVNVVITPLASYLYTQMGIEFIMVFEGIMLLVASLFEAMIDYRETQHGSGRFDLQAYREQFRAGWQFLKKKRACRKFMRICRSCRG